MSFCSHYSPLPIDEERRNQLVNRKARINKYGENDERLKFIFDDIQSEVEEHINTYFYPKFLRSKLYLNYVQVSDCFYFQSKGFNRLLKSF